jgi:hypothetical protein
MEASKGYLYANNCGFTLNYDYNFDDGTMQGWTNIDANGDGYEWHVVSDVSTSHNGEGHIGSESWKYNPGPGALFPDNYIVSPQVHFGSTSSIRFWACAEDANFPAEYFGVAVSTTGNTDATDFTTIQEWTMDKGETWKQYIVDLSAYEGQTGYVAIRHFGCYDLFTLNIDDIVIAQPDDGTPWTVIENIGDNSYELTGLDPQTDYWVQVRGNITPNGTPSSWSQVTDFTTLNVGTTKIMTVESQKPTINSGWFSLDGRRLSGKPTQKGVYIYNGKKVVI